MKNKLCTEAIVTFGVEGQIQKAQEELSELSVALYHYRDKKVPIHAVQEEIADVKIMCHQLSMMFGEDKINEIETQKLLRLQQLIKNKIKEKNENNTN